MRSVAGRPLLACLFAVLIAGCGGTGAAPWASAPGAAGPSPSEAPTGSTPDAPSGAPAGGGEVWLPEWAGADAPPEVAARRPLPFCGLERAPAPQPGIFVDRSVRLCFWNAHLAGTEAEFASVQTTMEGAPIATIYRLAADGTVEVLTDFTQDPFGGGTWLVSTCSEVIEAEGPDLLGVDDCDEGRRLG